MSKSDTTTDESTDDAPGTLVLADEPHRSLTWHHSVEFDGFEHTTACGRELNVEHVQDVILGDPRDDWAEWVPPTDGCPDCHRSVRGEQ